MIFTTIEDLLTKTGEARGAADDVADCVADSVADSVADGIATVEMDMGETFEEMVCTHIEDLLIKTGEERSVANGVADVIADVEYGEKGGRTL